MQQYACPNCGAPLAFFSSVSVHTTCTSCRSVVIRHDMNLETMGKVGELLDDMSPFQVGTTGTFEGENFKLLGRIKLVYSGGTWSEWFASFPNNKIGWLAEAQGNYMISFQVSNAQIEMPKHASVLQKWIIMGEEYYIEDVKKVKLIASEGELPFEFEPNSKGWSIDIRNDAGDFATVSTFAGEIEFFKGKYTDFDSLNFQNLRRIDGW